MDAFHLMTQVLFCLCYLFKPKRMTFVSLNRKHPLSFSSSRLTLSKLKKKIDSSKSLFF